MRHFYIITNDKKDPDFETTKSIQRLFEQRGAVCQAGTKQNDIPPKTECILVLGGDGTLLQAARDTFGKKIPLIGVNLGTLGFMAEVERQHIEEAVDALLSEQYKLERRMMLDGNILVHDRSTQGQDCHSQSDGCQEVNYGGKVNCVSMQAHALNDVVVTRQGGLRVLSYDVYVNGQYLTRYHADGVILATPTGSTGYNMSAGGPIVEPEAELILLTPICPHSLSPRSIILSAEDTIEIRIGYDRNGEDQEACVTFDGSVGQSLKSGDSIVVKRSEQFTSFVRIRQAGFLENLHRKMNQ